MAINYNELIHVVQIHIVQKDNVFWLIFIQHIYRIFFIYHVD